MAQMKATYDKVFTIYALMLIIKGVLNHTELYPEIMARAEEAEVLLSKRVQEMVLDGEEPPALYICRDGEDTDDHTGNSTVSPIPVIDLSLVLPSAAPTDISIQELQKLRSALSSWGCFQVSMLLDILIVQLLSNQLSQNRKGNLNWIMYYIKYLSHFPKPNFNIM